MRVLVVVGNDLEVNSSANLCHKSYIQGLIENACAVELLAVGDESVGSLTGFKKEDVSIYCYPMRSLYETLSQALRKRRSQEGTTVQNGTAVSDVNQETGILYRIKRYIHFLYGPYEVYKAWEKKAIAFKSTEKYDLVISLSFPPVSHDLVYQLLKKKHITVSKWIQIWEDPWCQDLVFKGLNGEDAVRRAQKEEARLLSVADEVLYVSPITLMHQKEMFSAYADKMRWLPVPTYYSNTSPAIVWKQNQYGYFGDYATQIRNLKPFYQAAKQLNIPVNICGYSDCMFASTKNIEVRPRISLEELKPLEDQTNVLVFLCNLKGGQIPGKIYQYSATKKTVLFILDGTEEEKRILRSFFEKFNRYVFCENTVEDITRAINELEHNKADCAAAQRPLDYFAPKKIVEKILHGAEEQL